MVEIQPFQRKQHLQLPLKQYLRVLILWRNFTFLVGEDPSPIFLWESRAHARGERWTARRRSTLCWMPICKIRTNLQSTFTICESERISARPCPFKCTDTASTIGSIAWLREAVGEIAQGDKVRIDHQRHHHRPPPYLPHPLPRLRQRAEYRSRCDDNWPVGGPGGLSILTISRRPRILATMASPGHTIGTMRRSSGVRSSTTNE